MPNPLPCAKMAMQKIQTAAFFVKGRSGSKTICKASTALASAMKQSLEIVGNGAAINLSQLNRFALGPRSLAGKSNYLLHMSRGRMFCAITVIKTLGAWVLPVLQPMTPDCTSMLVKRRRSPIQWKHIFS